MGPKGPVCVVLYMENASGSSWAYPLTAGHAASRYRSVAPETGALAPTPVRKTQIPENTSWRHRIHARTRAH